MVVIGHFKSGCLIKAGVLFVFHIGQILWHDRYNGSLLLQVFLNLLFHLLLDHIDHAQGHLARFRLYLALFVCFDRSLIRINFFFSEQFTLRIHVFAIVKFYFFEYLSRLSLYVAIFFDCTNVVDGRRIHDLLSGHVFYLLQLLKHYYGEVSFLIVG